MSNSSLPALLYCCRLQHVHINNETRTKHIYKLEVGKSNLCAFNVLTGGTIRAQEYGYRDGSTTYSASTTGIKSHSSETLKAFDSTVVVEEV